MLTLEVLNTLKEYSEKMERTVTLVLQQGEHAKRDELVQFLTDFVSVSDKLQFEQRETNGALRSPITFTLETDGKMTGIHFSGLPGGHEFNSLVLAVLQASGSSIRLDDSLQQIIRNIDEPLNFEVFISLSCHNCPDVVQSLNQFALLNPKITTETIDGGLFPELIEKRSIQGVPSVHLNGERFADGKVEVAKLVERLMARNPESAYQVTVPQLPQQDVTIVGGGPAGVAAAIYSARKGMKVTMVADRIGGQVKDTQGIENLISVVETTGPELVNALQNHMNQYEITIREHLRVERIEQGDPKTVHLSSGESFDSKTVIIATGAKWRELGIPGERENIGNGVAYCPHCDGPFFKGRDVAVIGGGNSGIEAALDLAGIVKTVTVYEFMDQFKADQVLLDQARQRDNITLLNTVATQEILAEDGKVTALQYQDRDSEEVHTQELSAVFVQIGLIPNSNFVDGLVERTSYGEIVINERGETSADGIFACGDVTTVPYKQIVVAMGEGAKASLAAFDYILKQ
ncbi:MAG: alkyl hydroperoxide reductase subunit F [Gammaproteobacteria bacterium]|jgi:alkyl hydroperoxide reductase subunit F|nr:alkyl hydroperoxide reductase subunit F [Gammaproteobacteria bacterium]MBT4608245.1 alkyl hydroperoxide reductase subunit F [Thiotrichales bacterium]MBT3966659.1 alkyl hydroperoxide reductase subunit F [Gammaproteobacteria bacterium]MBT4811201.1 alkyl hydroperoxide reductase subunit F [Thiotrichales bacterium]MBT5636472.1 alkyl hydroperoxide reductase subunit F [Gammaproteobacteria bacterium]